jgi:hypothetical protein
MIYRRPTNFDQCMEYMNALKSFDVCSEERRTLQRCACSLVDDGWFLDGMKPLYEKNAVVQLIMHSIVPLFQHLVLEEGVWERKLAETSSQTFKKYEVEYELLRQKMIEACKANLERNVSDTFAKMRASMLRYNENEIVQQALRQLFCCMKPARISLRLVNSRLVHSLANDTDVVESDDIPFEALSL